MHHRILIEESNLEPRGTYPRTSPRTSLRTLHIFFLLAYKRDTPDNAVYLPGVDHPSSIEDEKNDPKRQCSSSTCGKADGDGARQATQCQCSRCGVDFGGFIRKLRRFLGGTELNINLFTTDQSSRTTVVVKLTSKKLTTSGELTLQTAVSYLAHPYMSSIKSSNSVFRNLSSKSDRQDERT